MFIWIWWRSRKLNPVLLWINKSYVLVSCFYFYFVEETRNYELTAL